MGTERRPQGTTAVRQRTPAVRAQLRSSSRFAGLVMVGGGVAAGAVCACVVVIALRLELLERLLLRELLPVGRHTLFVEVAGCEPTTCEVEITDGDLAHAEVELVPR